MKGAAAKRIALAVIAPVALCAALEIGLRVGGYGFDPRLLLKDARSGRVVSNPDYGRLFFPRALARRPEPVSLQDPKPASEFRVFVIGESAAMGIPDPAYSFSRQLEVLFAAAAAGRHVVVANLAMTAINSHAFPLITREALRHDADALIVLAGNNEVVGPFGAGTVFDRTQPGRRAVRLKLWLRGTRLGQLLASLRERGADSDAPEIWGGLAMFLDHRVAADDPRLARTYADFRANMTEVLALANRAKVPVLLSTMPVNLRDCPPFADAPDGAALAAFRSGHAKLAAGDAAMALADLERARDLDSLRFRADTQINAILRDLAAGAPGVIAVDAERAVAADGPPGADLFWEHVHLTFVGNHRLASLVAAPLADLLQIPCPTAAVEEVARALAYTAADEARLATEILQMTERPPFTGQEGHEARRNVVLDRRIALRRQAREQTDACRSIYVQALNARPADWRLRMNYAQFLKDYTQDPGAEVETWRWIAHAMPDDQAARLHLARALQRGGREIEARALLEDLLRRAPDPVDVERTLGDLDLSAQRYAEAMVHYQRVLVAGPRHAGTLLNLGTACMRLDRLDEAERYFRESLAGQRTTAALANLGTVLIKQKRYAEAREFLAEAVGSEAGDASMLNNLGLCEVNLAQFASAVSHLTQALALQPDHPRAGLLRAHALAHLGRAREALADYRAVLERGFRPDAATGVALILAASPDPTLRNPPEALAIVKHVAGQAPAPFAELLEAQAAAEASDGRYESAAPVAERAAVVYDAEGRPALGAIVRERAARYRQGQPAWLPEDG